MAELLQEDQIVYDPLTPVTRAERRMLLGLSGLGLAIVVVPLVPTKLAILGIEFSANNQANLLRFYAMVLVFFAAAFAVYAWSDYVAWRRRINIRIAEYAIASAERRAKPNADIDSLFEQNPEYKDGFGGFAGAGSWTIASKVINLRFGFEFVFPVIFAAIVIIMLFAFSLHLSGQ